MNKSDLVAFVAGQTGLSKQESEKCVNAIFQGITESLRKGQEAAFVGFGTFSVSKRGAREGRNPKTGEVIQIAAVNQPKFKPGKALRDAVN